MSFTTASFFQQQLKKRRIIFRGNLCQMVVIIWIWEKYWVQQQKFNLIKYSIDFHLKSHLFIDEGKFCWKKRLTFDTQNANAHWKNCIDWNLIEYSNRFKVKEKSQPRENEKNK